MSVSSVRFLVILFSCATSVKDVNIIRLANKNAIRILLVIYRTGPWQDANQIEQMKRKIGR